MGDGSKIERKGEFTKIIEMESNSIDTGKTDITCTDTFIVTTLITQINRHRIYE